MYVYSGYVIAFDREISWGFNDDFDNSSSSYTDILKIDFLILGEGDNFGFNGSFGATEKKLKLILVKPR